MKRSYGFDSHPENQANFINVKTRPNSRSSHRRTSFLILTVICNFIHLRPLSLTTYPRRKLSSSTGMVLYKEYRSLAQRGWRFIVDMSTICWLKSWKKSKPATQFLQLGYDLLYHSTIVGDGRDILGDDVIGWGSHNFCKLLRDPKRVSWHQEASYWPVPPSKMVTVYYNLTTF